MYGRFDNGGSTLLSVVPININEPDNYMTAVGLPAFDDATIIVDAIVQNPAAASAEELHTQVTLEPEAAEGAFEAHQLWTIVVDERGDLVLAHEGVGQPPRGTWKSRRYLSRRCGTAILPAAVQRAELSQTTLRLDVNGPYVDGEYGHWVSCQLEGEQTAIAQIEIDLRVLRATDHVAPGLEAFERTGDNAVADEEAGTLVIEPGTRTAPAIFVGDYFDDHTDPSEDEDWHPQRLGFLDRLVAVTRPTCPLRYYVSQQPAHTAPVGVLVLAHHIDDEFAPDTGRVNAMMAAKYREQTQSDGVDLWGKDQALGKYLGARASVDTLAPVEFAFALTVDQITRDSATSTMAKRAMNPRVLEGYRLAPQLYDLFKDSRIRRIVDERDLEVPEAGRDDPDAVNDFIFEVAAELMRDRAGPVEDDLDAGLQGGMQGGFQGGGMSGAQADAAREARERIRETWLERYREQPWQLLELWLSRSGPYAMTYGVIPDGRDLQRTLGRMVEDRNLFAAREYQRLRQELASLQATDAAGARLPEVVTFSKLSRHLGDAQRARERLEKALAMASRAVGMETGDNLLLLGQNFTRMGGAALPSSAEIKTIARFKTALARLEPFLAETMGYPLSPAFVDQCARMFAFAARRDLTLVDEILRVHPDLEQVLDVVGTGQENGLGSGDSGANGMVGLGEELPPPFFGGPPGHSSARPLNEECLRWLCEERSPFNYVNEVRQRLMRSGRFICP
ncbi:MAG: hypothetical protein AAF677_01215 [Pseudomonadota bacterium]